MKNELWKWRNGGKRGNPKAGFPLFPPFLGNLANNARFPHFHQLRRKQADGKVENQKQVSHFPTATNPLSPGTQTRAAGGLRPPPGGGALRAALRVKE